MDFWRIFRLLSSKRWLIAAIVLITGVIVFVGTQLRALNREYSATAVLQPQDPAAAQAQAIPDGSGVPVVNGNPAEQRTTNISDLLMTLRSSSDITNRAAALLKLPETDRRKEVSRILTKNGYFAQINADVENRIDQQIKDGELNASKRDVAIKNATMNAQAVMVNNLAVASDDSGKFAGGGAGAKADEIATRLRKIVTYDSVDSPFSTDQNPQVVNQIKVVADSPRAAEAELYANMVSVAFLDYYANRSTSSVTARIELTKEKLVSANAVYNKAQKDVVAYSSSSSAPSLSSAQQQVLANEQGYENQLNLAQQELSAATASVQRLQSLVATTSPTQSVQLPSAENPQVRALEAEVARLRIAFNQVEQSNYGTGSDVYKQAKASLDQAVSELQAEQRKPYGATAPNVNYSQLQAQLAQVQVKRDDAATRVQTLTTQVAAQKRQLATLPVAAAKLADLQRVANLRQNNVAGLEKALAGLELEAIASGSGTVNIISSARAELIEGMTLGQRIKIVVYGMILVAIFASLMFVALDALDNAVKTASDAQRLLDLSVIGQIPTHIPELVRGARIVALDPLSPAAEAYRLLRTDLIFLGLERSFKTLVVAPIRPGQGATTTAGNLAIALAQSGRKVILVDADLRRPKLHAIFGVSNDAGLSTVLKGEADYNSALLPTDVENLTLLPAGAPVMNPSELIGSGMMGAFVKRLRDMAEYVIIDSPSPASFADGAVLASIADATLLVLRAGQAPDGAAEAQVRERLEKARANVLGMVLNDIEPERLLGSRRHQDYQPALVSGNVGQIGSTPLPALPKPSGSVSRPLPTPGDGEKLIDGEEGETSNENGGTLTEAPMPKPQIRKPRIVSTTVPTASSNSNGTGEKKLFRTPETPLVLLLSLGLSTAVSALTLALSRAGR